MDDIRLKAQEIAHDLPGQILRFEDFDCDIRTEYENNSFDSCYDQVAEVVEDCLYDLEYLSDVDLERVRQLDFARLTCEWLPDASLESLEKGARFIIWLFCWDAPLTDPYSIWYGGMEEAAEFGEHTLVTARIRLGIEDGHDSPRVSDLVDKSKEYLNTHLGQHISDRIVAQQERLPDGIQTPINFTGFTRWRACTMGVFLMLDLSIILNKIELSAEVVEWTEFHSLALAVESLIVLTDGLWGLKQDIQIGVDFLNFVPMSMAQSDVYSLNHAAQETVEAIRVAVDFFRINSEAFKERVDKDIPNYHPDEADRLVKAWSQLPGCYFRFGRRSGRFAEATLTENI